MVRDFGKILIMIKVLNSSDIQLINEMVSLYKVTFPNSFQNLLGDDYIYHSIKWFTINQKKRQIIIYQTKGKIIGFLSMKNTNDEDRFSFYIFRELLITLIRKPWLIINTIFIKKLYSMIANNNSKPIFKDCLELVTIGVIPSWYKRGVGEYLLNYFYSFAKKNDIKKAILYVKDTNKNAIRFYNKKGWKKTNVNYNNYLCFEKNINCD